MRRQIPSEVLDPPFPQWVHAPFENGCASAEKKFKTIEERLETGGVSDQGSELSKQLAVLIRQIGDLERLIAKVALGKISPREMVQIRKALSAIITNQNLLSERDEEPFKKIADQLHPVN
jgi:DNA mismatch repair protein MutS